MSYPFTANEDVTPAIMNEVSIIKLSGSAISTLSPTYAGQVVFCNSTGSGYTANHLYKRNSSNSGWDDLTAIIPDIEVYPLSTVIGDYSYVAQSLATASSEPTNSVTLDTAGTGANTFGNGTTHQQGEKFTDTTLRGQKLVSATFNLQRVGTLTTGNVVAELWNYDTNTLIATSTNGVDITTIPTSGVNPYTFNFGSDAIIPTGSNFAVMVSDVSLGGTKDVSNNCSLLGSASSTYAGGVLTRRTSTFGDTSTQDARGSIVLALNHAGKTQDNDTTTRWESSSEVNPWVKLELSGAADKEPSGIAIYPHANTTVTQFKIQVSPDGSTWTDVRLVNVSDLTMAAWNYIRFNRGNQAFRYLRVYGNDGTAKVFAISELKVLVPTESQWNRRHGHKSISGTDATIALGE